MTLATICQNAAKEIGFPAPANIIGNSDPNAAQLLRLANREGEELSQVKAWNILVSEGSVTLATGDQDYLLATDLRYVIPSTTWDRTNKRIVITPITSQEWQFLKGWTTIQGLSYRARIRNNQLEFEQAITSADNGKVIYYEYVTNQWAASSGGTAQRYFTADDDTARLDEELITQGVVWRFKKAKGLDWQDDYQFYLQTQRRQVSRDGGQRRIAFTNPLYGIGIGINVSDRDYG